MVDNCKYCWQNCPNAGQEGKDETDIIRKTPEELADWISNVPYREGDVCPPTHKCSLDMSCEKCWLAWLQKEASE